MTWEVLCTKDTRRPCAVTNGDVTLYVTGDFLTEEDRSAFVDWLQITLQEAE